MLVKSRPKWALIAMAVIGCLGCDRAKTNDGHETEIIRAQHYLHGHPPMANGGFVNVVIEIPAGTSAKWEVEKGSGNLVWESVGDSLRVVDYLPYPANYGMIPQTLLPKELGGDGDPLDVIVLGPAIERGSIVPAKIIGMLALLDNGEQDDKLLAVSSGSHFSAVDDIAQLDSLYKGALDVLTIWFENYKGTTGQTVVSGVVGPAEAQDILQAAIRAYQGETHKETP